MGTSTSTPKEPQSSSGKMLGFISGLILILGLAFIARWLKLLVYDAQFPMGIPGKALEYPLWAALVGLAANWILKVTNTYNFVRTGFRTELFLKIGLVLLGTTISFKTILTAASGAIIQGIIMVTLVYLFCWWLAGKFGLPYKLKAIMSAAIAVCGVSAAIAAAGSVRARKEEITYITALVILTALPLMVISPLLAGWMGLTQPVAGAWFGGNVDTTAAVVGAGTIYGETAQKVASIVKSAQNTLIGVVAFLLAIYAATRSEEKGEKPSPVIIWQRFPKFVLGFLVASFLFTFGVIVKDSDAAKAITALKDWAFCLAFVSMGLELSAGEFKKMGWSPVIVYLVVTLFNTLLALGLAWLIFGVLLPVNILEI